MQNTKKAMELNLKGITIYRENATIAFCDLYNNYYGIYLKANNVSIKNCKVYGNSFAGSMPALMLLDTEKDTANTIRQVQGAILQSACFIAWNLMKAEGISPLRLPPE